MTRLDNDFAFADALDDALSDSVDPRGSDTAGGAPELAALLSVAQSLKAAASELTPRDEFRAAARQRLLESMAPAAPVRSLQPAHQQPLALRPILDRIGLWVARFAAGLAALSFAGVAAASASANALPGDPLYGVKQAAEALEIQTAPDEAARQEVLLRQAARRLVETERLLEQGRDADAATTADHYDATLSRATQASTSPSEATQTSLEANEARLAQLLETAPPPARAGLERALEATQRGLGRARPTPAAHDEDSESSAASVSAPANHRPEATPAPREREATLAQPPTPAVASSHGNVPSPRRADGDSHGDVPSPARADGGPHRDAPSPGHADVASHGNAPSPARAGPPARAGRDAHGDTPSAGLADRDSHGNGPADAESHADHGGEDHASQPTDTQPASPPGSHGDRQPAPPTHSHGDGHSVSPLTSDSDARPAPPPSSDTDAQPVSPSTSHGDGQAASPPGSRGDGQAVSQPSSRGDGQGDGHAVSQPTSRGNGQDDGQTVSQPGQGSSRGDARGSRPTPRPQSGGRGRP